MVRNHDEFLKTRVCYGLILRADLATIDEVKKLISERPGLEVIYQLMDVGRLWIVRANERGGSER